MRHGKGRQRAVKLLRPLHQEGLIGWCQKGVLRKGRRSETMCYLMGMNDVGSRQEPVLQTEVLRREEMEGP